MNMLLQGCRAWCMYTMVDTHDRKWAGACTACAAARAAARAAMERARGRAEWKSSGAPWSARRRALGKSKSEVSRSRVVIARASSKGRRRRRRAPRASFAHQRVPLQGVHPPALMHHTEELRPAPARSDPAAPIAFVDRAPRAARRRIEFVRNSAARVSAKVFPARFP